jgi:acyl-CoA reductase-like NAD-dependent aldehyde dehydrogenase
MRIVPHAATWAQVEKRARELCPEAFQDGRPLNLANGKWGQLGNATRFSSPNDGTDLYSLPMLDLGSATEAVRAAAKEQAAWGARTYDERRRRVEATLDDLQKSRDLLALTLAWEIGKPMRLAESDVDRCIEGVRWYLDEAESMSAGREPLGLISNIASWNYPMSVLMHAVLVQVLVGNSAIAKTPTDGGAYTLTLAFALARRHGLPVSLVSGSGGRLSEALVRHEAIECMAFVGGKASGRDIATSLVDRGKRHMLEMEGLNAWGIWDYSDWPALMKMLKKGFEYGKQRCTAYPRIVIERRLFPRFLEHYLPMLASLKFGHPLAVDQEGDAFPDLDFGPLINSKKVEELHGLTSAAIAGGAVALHQAEIHDGRFLTGQDQSAYFAPISLLGVPRGHALYYAEAFGPIDTLVPVSTKDELVAEMNVSNGSLVASIASDDENVAKRLASQVRGFKVGVNRIRSRGDRDEAFGGIGESWRGSFVGGKYLVLAVTRGQKDERLFGNFDDYTQLVPVR